MNVLVISLNYAPEETGFAPHVAASCEYMAAKGHTVRVVTGFPFAPYWSRFPGYTGKLTLDETIRGVKVARVTHFIPRQPRSPTQRILMEATFCISAVAMLLLGRLNRPDVVLYVGAQPAIAMLTKWLARIWRVPYVVNINDFAAEIAEDTGIVRSQPALRLLTAFEHSAYRRASAAMVICEAFRETLVAIGYPHERIHVIPSPVDVETIRPVPRDDAFRRSIGIGPDDFVVLYSGSMGQKQDLFTAVSAAILVRARLPAVRWVLIGEGELKRDLEKEIRRLDLGHQVVMLPLQAEAEVPRVLSSADVLLLCQLKSVKDSVIPSKLLTYMAAGMPVIAAVNPRSQAAKLLERSNGGIIVRPENPEELAAAVGAASRGVHDLRAMGMRNREYALEEFAQKRVLARQEAVLLNAALSRSPKDG